MSKSIFNQPEKSFPHLLSQVNSFFGYTYSNDEKQEWWNQQKKKFKIGLLRTHDLDKQVSIFGEFFDFSKKSLSQKPVILSDENKQRQKANFDTSLKPIGFNTSEQLSEDILRYNPEKLLTSKDFETLYLGWLNTNPSYSSLTESEKEIITQSMKHLFRFIFGNKPISEINNFHKNLIIAYTPLTPMDKLPCDSIAVPSDEIPPQIQSIRQNMLESLIYRKIGRASGRERV